METLLITIAAVVLVGCLVWGVWRGGWQAFVDGSLTPLLALATIGFGFLWMMSAVVGAFQAGHPEDFGLPMVVYYSPWFITGLWILRGMFTTKGKQPKPLPPVIKRDDSNEGK
jgi:hypothetical protein